MALLKKKRFVFPGRTDTVKACGYVKDLVRSMEFMLQRGEPTVTYNFCHAERYTTQQITQSFSRVAGYKPARMVFPLSFMMFGAWIFEMLAKIGIKTSINRPRILKLILSNNIQPTRLTELAFPYAYTLDEALADWLKDSGGADFL